MDTSPRRRAASLVLVLSVSAIGACDRHYLHHERDAVARDEPARPAVRDASAPARIDASAPSRPDASAPPRVDAGGPARCADRLDCDDGLFCNGVEQCAPHDPASDERGCARGPRPCGPLDVCEEDGARCVICERVDEDGDGHASPECGGDDCDDRSASTHPGAPEVCDGRDEDCDGAVDDGVAQIVFLDRDGDGVGTGPGVLGCTTDDGVARFPGDCDDDDPSRRPGAPEECDGDDDDCDGRLDEGLALTTFFQDCDLDGYGDASAPRALACAAPERSASCVGGGAYVEIGGDCSDGDATIHPGGTEICNDRDDDCDMVSDESTCAP